MKVIGIHTKYRVIELFLTGYTFDEIAEQLDVSKGSVVSIVSDFREGRLQLPVHMTAYVDELRRVVVDMKKNGVSLTQLKSYNRIYSKLQEMGASSEEAEGWIDICQDIASSTETGEHFTHMISNLVKLSLETGLDLKGLIEDYHEKLSTLPKLNREIEQKKEGLNKIEVKYEKGKEQARRELDSLTRKTEAAWENFQRQTRNLQSQLDEFISRNRLSWEKVNTVRAILKDELNRVGAGERDIGEISKEIATAGSLSVHIREKQAKIERLGQEKKARTSRVDGLKNEEKDLELSVTKKQIAKDFLDEEFEEKRKRVNEIERVISGYIEDLTASRLIIKFLSSPAMLIGRDFDQLLKLISLLRDQRLTIESRMNQVHDGVPYELIMHRLSKYLDKHQDRLEKGREQLAYYLIPIFKDKVVFISGYAVARMGNPIQNLRIKQ